MKPFNVRNWYWIVAGDESRVCSSAAGDYVLPTNAAYVAWRADGTLPTRIVNEAELGEVLAQYRLRPTHAAVLDGYLERQAMDVIDAVHFKIMFNHENRIRAIERTLLLNGSPPNLTPAQARAAVKALL
jgi:hypothetical protein